VNSTQRATSRFLMGTAVAAIGAGLNAARWMHCTKPNAAFETKFWLVLCAISVGSGLVRFLYYRNRRDYFAEEMDHRRALTKKWYRSGA
jgi:hypothetical protein